ncbi:peptidylprolyl isomerase [Calothrix sp. NIES-2098]|uniref:peptidylprolyl isomerase n=1 Tax=Calothrix sp. NIES-2098 TaxID=1954171 RepID=UPI000B5DE36D|nr:PpiC-type peptidyl-prolyl cis-trans isomerase [Calothrix sp. NIES-2098]
MQEVLEQTELQETIPEIHPATDDEILAYLRSYGKIAEVAAQVEYNTHILKFCEKFDITVSDEELQAAGNEFRRSHNLLSASETQTWLDRQRMTAEDWTEGIRVKWLEQKLKEHLFGEQVDSDYLNNRKQYKRVALSQILVQDLNDALKIFQALQKENASFCALALEYSQGKQSKDKGGFVGVHFLPKLMPEVAEAIANANEGEVVRPIQTKLGYHIIRIEKWFPVHLNESLREELIDSLFQAWLRERNISFPH